MYATSDAKVLDFKFLTTVGMSLQLGGFLSECPHNLERFLAPALTNVGTAAKMNPETGIYGDVIVGAGADGPDPKLARSIGPEEYHYLKAEPHYGSYYKIGCPSLVRFHTPGLFFIADDLIVRNNPKLVTLAFPRLHGVGMLSKPPMEYGDIIVEGNTKLAVFYAPKASLADKEYKKYDKKYAGERDGAEYMGSARIAIVKNPSLKLVVIMSTPDVKFYIDPSQNLKSLVAIYALPYKIKDGIDIFHKEIEDIEAVINEAKMKVEDSKLAGVEAVGDWFGDKLDFLKHRDYSLSDRLDKLKYDGGEQNKYDYGQVKPEPEPLPAVSADALSADTAFLGATPLDAPSPDAGDNFDI